MDQVVAGLRTYPVQRAARQPLLDFIVAGLHAKHCRILFESAPDRAPFVLTFESQTGERMGVVAYAFLATRTPTKHRPQDERSFQIKYGNKEDYRNANVHELWQDRLGLLTTVLVGIDLTEEFFVAADPVIHSPTKFFIRLEFKDGHVGEILNRGWFAWQRDRRIRQGTEQASEILIGGKRDRFLDLVRFERAAKGLPQDERLLLSKKPEWP